MVYYSGFHIVKPATQINGIFDQGSKADSWKDPMIKC
jgi:hypothetical protein